MKTDSNSNTHHKWLSEDKIADNIGIPSSYSISNLSLNQITNLLITSVLSEIELDNKNFNISNIESLQLKIQSIITAIINNQFIIYEKLIQKSEKDLRYYISKELNHRVQEESNKVYIQHLLNQLEEYEKIKKQFDFIVSTDITVETEDTINEINQLKEENTRLKLKIKELEIKTKDNSHQYHYIHNENFSPNFSLLNHHQRISSISSNSNNQSPLITEFTNSAGNKTTAKKNSIRNLYYQPHPILDSLISPKSSFKYNNSNNKNVNYESSKNKCVLHKNGIQYTQINTNTNNPGTDEISKHIHNHSNKFHSNKKENCFVNEFLSILKGYKPNNKNNTQNNSNNNNNNNQNANVIKTNKHKKSSSQDKLTSKVDNQFNSNEKQLIKNYYNNFIIYRNNNNLLNQKSKHLSYQKGVIHNNNSNNNLIKILTSTNYNKTITVNSKSTNITKQSKLSTLKKSTPINMGLIYSSNIKKHKQQYE